jgi:hypothetical protein
MLVGLGGTLQLCNMCVPHTGSINLQRSKGWPAGRQYIGDLPNSDLRQMMMTVDTNFWGAPGHRACVTPL